MFFYSGAAANLSHLRYEFRWVIAPYGRRRDSPKHDFTRYLSTRNNSITICSKVLPDKLTGMQLVKKFLAFYGTRRFIAAFTSARHLSLFLASSIQSIIPLPEDPSEYFPLIYAWVSPMVSFPQVFTPKPFKRLSPPHTRYMPRPSYSSRFHHPHNSGWVKVS
jgi:hypothetical protein